MSGNRKMMGRLGWHGQCSCCCGQDDKDQIRAQEKREWIAEFRSELDEAWRDERLPR